MFDRFDRRIHYLRISVTDRCNLRCSYCMPEDGIPLLDRAKVLSFEEIRDVVAGAVDLGVDKIRITGGEPLVRHGIVDLVRMIAAVDGVADLAMTTNGVLLKDFALLLREAGIRRINISLDTLDPERFKAITRMGNVHDVLEGVKAAEQAGFASIKLNCVVNESPSEPDAVAVAAFGQRHGFEVRYIRKMDLKAGRFWPVIGGNGGHCDSCSRLRLSSDGRVFPCLFSDLSYSVRDYGIEEALRMAVENKPAAGKHSQMGIHAIGG